MLPTAARVEDEGQHKKEAIAEGEKVLLFPPDF